MIQAMVTLKEQHEHEARQHHHRSQRAADRRGAWGAEE